MSLDERRFRDALGAFPTGVAIVTGLQADGTRLGMTVSSFNSVSLDPPLVLFSVARSANSFEAWTSLDRYAVNILSERQEEVSNRFARSRTDKWENLAVIDGETGLPTLPDSPAVFECEAYAQHDGGDHAILVGRVVAMRVGIPSGQDPLVFFGGRYRRLDRKFKDMPPHGSSMFEGW